MIDTVVEDRLALFLLTLTTYAYQPHTQLAESHFASYKGSVLHRVFN
jgi:hypothetical protein